MIKYNLSIDSWDKKEYEAIDKVIRSKQFTMGKEVEKTEKKFANFFGKEHCVMTNSGSSANLVMIASLILSNRLIPGDEVIVPAVSWSTTYNPLQQYGLKLKFVDIDLHTLNLDLSALKNAITKNTKMIFLVNLLGNNNNFDEIEKICSKNGIFYVEDNCESMGSTFREKYSGTFGLIGTFSSFFSHHISSMEGGYCLTDDLELYNIMKSIRAHGWTRNIDLNALKNTKPQNGFYKSFDFIYPGYNVRPIEIEAAIAHVQLDKLPQMINNRRKNYDYFFKKALNHPLFTLQKETGKSSWFGFALNLRKKYKKFRDEYSLFLSSQNIESRPIVTGNFTRHDVIKYFNYEIHGQLENADYIHDYSLFVGNNGQLIYREIDWFFNVTQNFLRKINES